MAFAIYQHESATGIHVFPTFLNPPHLPLHTTFSGSLKDSLRDFLKAPFHPWPHGAS